jgi:hypothetical protein
MEIDGKIVALVPALSEQGMEIDGKIVALVPAFVRPCAASKEDLIAARKPVEPHSIISLERRLDG